MALFFASYARADGRYNPELAVFFAELREEIRARTGRPVDEVAFVDATEIRTGTEWRDVLADALSTSRVCVCLCSPTYYSSEFCGREFFVFQQRSASWKQAAPAGREPRFIVPVIWQPSPNVPRVISAMQQYDSRFPREYADWGLRQLINRKGRELGSAYKQVVSALGDLIEEVLALQPALPPLGAPIDFEQVPSAFSEAVASRPLGVQGLVLGATADWQPFDDGETARRLIEASVTSTGLQYVGLLPPGAGFDAAFAAAERHRQIVVVLASPLGLADPALANALTTINARLRPNVGVIVPWGGAMASLPDAQRTSLEARVRTALASYAADTSGPHDFTGVRSAGQLRAAIQQAAARLLLALTHADEPRRAEDDERVRVAATAGIEITTRSMLSGPGGVS